jgi:hypothetical protein
MVKDTEPWTIFYAVQTVNLLAACQQKWFLPSEIACWQWPVGPSPPLSVFQTAISPSSLGYREFLACIVNLRRINCCDSVRFLSWDWRGCVLNLVAVGNIPYDATEEQLVQICEEVGPVVSFRFSWTLQTLLSFVYVCVCVCHVVG